MSASDEPPAALVRASLRNGAIVLVGTALVALLYVTAFGWDGRIGLYVAVLLPTGAFLVVGRRRVARWNERRLRRLLR